ncbi:SGNH/GDSL hydrolase family protein [Flavobacteriaceae bacterium]|nr:SGNH/GDSL hydrolase family protein [Flavobacteriaceae bacterium]
MNYIRLVIVPLIVGLNFLSCNINAEIPEVPNYEQNENPINEEPEPRHIKLISLGDSYTIGQSVCEDCRFPAQLRDSLQTYFSENDSISLEIIAQTGWTTSNLKSAITAAEPSSDFDLVTLLIGVNNQYQNKPFSLYQTEFIELTNTAITLANGDASKLIVVSIPDYAYTPFGQNYNPSYISEQLLQYNDYAETYCNENNLNYVYITDITQQGLTNTELVATDNLHPSELAYTKFVERILPLALEVLEQ